MAARGILLIFVLPAAASLAFGGAVMYGLASQGPASHAPAAQAAAPAPGPRMELVGLLAEYAESDAVEARVRVDPQLGCGDLYVTVFRDGEPVEQQPFRGACPGDGGLVPADDWFSWEAGGPGAYEITAEMVLEGGAASARGGFTVK